MARIFFTADLHFGHSKMLVYCNRPYKDTAEMDEKLIENWNATVKPEDSVYLLGDVGFYTPEKTTELVKRLHGKIYLILGNHDRALIKHSRAQIKEGQKLVFEWMKDIYYLKVPDPDRKDGYQPIIMCHYPFRTWNHMNYGSWHLHGHCHGGLPYDGYTKIMDVGVDPNEYRPVSYDEVKAYMAKKLNEPPSMGY